MIFLSHQAWSFLRPTLKQGSAAFICALVIVALILPITKIYATNDTKELSELLKSELGLEVSADKLSNLPLSKQAEMINFLSMIERGRTLFSGKTPAENALGVLAQLVEGEVDKGVWDTVLNSLLKLTQTPVEKTKDIVDKSTEIFLIAATIKAMPAIPRERLVFDYIQNYRIKGKNDEDAWKEMVSKYNGIADLIGGCNLNALITGDGECQRVVTLQRGGESLHSYAKITYESFNLAQKLSSNPQQKEALKQWVLSEVEKAQNTKVEKPSLLSRIWEFITKPFRFIGGKIVNLFTKDDKECKITINLSGVSFEMKEGNEPNQRPTGLTKAHISSGVIKKNDIGQYHIELTFTSEGKHLFSEITDRLSRNGGSLSLYINNNLISSPVVMAKIVSDTLLVGGEPYAQIKQIVGKQNVNNPCPEKEIVVPVQQNNPLKPKTTKLPPQTPTQNQKNTHTRQTEPDKTQSGGAIPGQVTGIVVDQFGNPVADAKFWLVDPYGTNIVFSRFTNENGRLQTDNGFVGDGAIPAGKYTLHIEKKSIYSGANLGYDTAKIDVELPVSGLWLDKLILKKWPSAVGILLDSSGQPPGNKTYKSSPDSVGGYYPHITIRNSDGKIADEFEFGGSSSDQKTGRFGSKPLQPAHYSLKVWIPGGFQKSDTVMASREFDVSYNQEEINLGQVIFNGIPF